MSLIHIATVSLRVISRRHGVKENQSLVLQLFQTFTLRTFNCWCASLA
jgi:hypothetical protein